MDAFPEFMKHPANRISTETQYTKGIEGYVFDGAMEARWPSGPIRRGENLPNTFMTMMSILRWCKGNTLCNNGRQIPVGVGGEFLIPKGTLHREKPGPVRGPFMPLEEKGPSESIHNLKSSHSRSLSRRFTCDARKISGFKMIGWLGPGVRPSMISRR